MVAMRFVFVVSVLLSFTFPPVFSCSSPFTVINSICVHVSSAYKTFCGAHQHCRSIKKLTLHIWLELNIFNSKIGSWTHCMTLEWSFSICEQNMHGLLKKICSYRRKGSTWCQIFGDDFLWQTALVWWSTIQDPCGTLRNRTIEVRTSVQMMSYFILLMILKIKFKLESRSFHYTLENEHRIRTRNLIKDNIDTTAVE